jgi:hypothetical protein
MHGIRTGRIEFLAGRKKKQERLNPECTKTAEFAEGDWSGNEGRKKGGDRDGPGGLAVGASEVGAWLVTLGLGRFGFLLLVFGELLVGVAVGIA